MTQVLTWNSGDNENIAIYQFSDDTIIEIGNDLNPTILISWGFPKICYFEIDYEKKMFLLN